MPAFGPRTLGRTGLTVSPVGIGGGSRISERDTLYAFDQGVNYFFFSSDLHHSFYQASAPALKALCGRGSRLRDQVVLATVSYVGDPDKLVAALIDQFSELRVDCVDVFHWGWITDHTDCDGLFGAAPSLKQAGTFATFVRNIVMMQERAAEVSEAIVSKGLARFVGASFHSRAAAARYVDGVLDVLMLRYNIGHSAIEQDIFPLLSADRSRNPGIVAFNTSHEGLSFFSERPDWYPGHLPVPTHGDSYRFALSNPYVDMVLIGPANRLQLDDALDAISKGPLAADHMAFLRRYGDLRVRRTGKPVRRAPGETASVSP